MKILLTPLSTEQRMHTKKRYFSRDPREGQAVMTVVFLTLLISTAGFISFSRMALDESRVSNEIYMSEKSLFLSEAGVEDIAYRIQKATTYTSPETLSIDNATTTTTVTAAGTSREIVSSSSVLSYVRKTKIVLDAGSGAAFSYGVQTGKGGFLMENTSTLNGSIYTSGDITGKNSPTITGDAFVASTSKIIDFPNIQGHARAHNIINSTIGKNATATESIVGSTITKHAYANKIGNSTVTGNAYYTMLIGTTTVTGTTNSGLTQPADLPVIPMPIPDSDIFGWEAVAELGGVHTSPCPWDLSSGTTTIGPLKINCDMNLTNSAVVVLTGPVWVVGSFSIANNAKLLVNSTYGSNSEVFVVDNPANRTTSSQVSVKNSTIIRGSGTVGSYLTVISMNNSSETGGAEVAIDPENSNTGSIYYAPHGEILLANSNSMKEATAYKIHMKNTASVTYESGLNAVEFSTGPQGGYSIGRWHETQ